MTAFIAIMRHVDHRSRVIGFHQQQITRLKALQPLAGFQNGQGAEQPETVEFNDVFRRHDPQIARVLQKVHADVTACASDARAAMAYVGNMFGIEIIDASLLPAMFVALLAGLLSFLSPCVLPVVPPYLAYMSGVSMGDLGQNSRRAIVPALFFVLGLSTVFLILGMAASAAGMALLQYQSWLNTGAGIIVMIFGAHFVGIYRIGFLDREARLDAGDRGGSAFGAYLLGLAFAFGWTPCIGPQLGSILTLAASEGSILRGTSLLAVYALGLSVPFLLVAAFLHRLTGALNWMKRHMEQIERAMGLLLWTIGLLMLTGGFSAMSFWLLDTFPFLAALG